MARLNITMRDYSDEKSTVSLFVNEPAADGSDLAATFAACDAIVAAVEALSIGNIVKHSLTIRETETGDGRPASAYAQRESGLRLFWEEDQAPFDKGYVTIPMPDLALVATAGTDEVDLAGVTVVNVLVAALEALMESDNGNSINFYRGVIVGRRN